ncbi:MAG TPA: SDR family oxidoreductase [Armatimonadota bacterium]|jgi:3-oxoacyl-[acyl-carrier protein] reductase
MDLNLKGKAALVAASSKGLGYASARALALEGAAVCLNGRTEDALRSAAERLRGETGSTVVTAVGDMGKAEDISRVVETALSELGRLDVLVTNVGGPPPGGFDDFDDAGWANAVEVTLMPVVRLIRAALPALKAAKGAIVNIQSTSVKEPIAGLLLSNALRPGVVGLSKTISAELGRAGVRINTVGPGSFNTDRIKSLTQRRAKEAGISVEEQAAIQNARIPLRRLGHPDELGRLVAFLASDAASYITGQTLFCDGGATAFSL